MNYFDTWDTILPQYPKWNLGGSGIELEEYGEQNGKPYYMLTVFEVGQNELDRYCQLLKQNGFAPAGKYPSEVELYKQLGGVSYYFGCDNACEDEGVMRVGFTIKEPHS